MRNHAEGSRKRAKPWPRPFGSYRSKALYGLIHRKPSAVFLSLRLTAAQLLHLGLILSARRGALALRSRLLACCALDLLALCLVGDALRICHVLVTINFPKNFPARAKKLLVGSSYSLSSWANFSTSFLVPYPLNCTVIFASSPSPSRAAMMPSPYFGCRTRTPLPSPVRPDGAGISIFGRAGYRFSPGL